MSDADAERKAKAARAKKLLAQRQKAKAVPTTTSAAPSSPSSTIADTATPSGRTSLNLDDGVRDEVERAVTPATPKVEEAIPEQKAETSPLAQDPASNLQETVSLLIAERVDLQGQLAKLEASLAAAKGDSQLLVEGRTLISRLEREKVELEQQLGRATEDEKRRRSVDDDFEKMRDEFEGLRMERDRLVKEQQEAKAARKQEDHRNEERIAEVEKQLERIREREGGLEAEVGRLRQGNGELSSKLNEITSELEGLRATSLHSDTTVSDLRSSREALQADHDSLQVKYGQLESQHSSLQNDHSALTAEFDSLKSEQASSSTARSELESSVKSTRADLESTRSSLDKASKRADAAEKKKIALQSENDELVRQLEEVRGRVVQIMEEKADMASRVDSLEGKEKGWEKARSDHKAQVEDLQSLREQNTSLAEQSRSLSARYDDLARAHSDLRSQLESSESNPIPSHSVIQANGSDQTLEASQYASRIRELESALHASATRVHDLSKQLTNIQAAYSADPKNLFIAQSPSTELPLSPPYLPHNRLIDAALPAAVRHKRQVSLTALKARMAPPPIPTLNRLDSLAEEGDTPSGEVVPIRKQFGDEIVFCCPACEGDLITL